MTSSTLSALEPFTSALNGPPAAWDGRYKLHLPRLSAVDSTVCPSRVTVTFSSGSAQPQKCIGRSLCKTMWLLRIFGKRTSASASKLPDRVTVSRNKILGIVLDNTACLRGRVYRIDFE